MHTPEVLKAIYALEHGQSVDRMIQTLIQFGVTRAEIEVLLNDKGDAPAAAALGVHWAPLAERIAAERTARGWPVVSLEMLRRATTTSARVETVRIHAQNRRISLVGAQGAGSSPAPLAPPRPVSSPPPPPATPLAAAAVAAPVPVRPAIVAVPKAPFAPHAAVPSSLLRDLERAAQLLMLNAGIESALPPSQIETLRTTLRTFLEAAEDAASLATTSTAATAAAAPHTGW